MQKTQCLERLKILTISKDKTVLVNGGGTEAAIKSRISMIENELKLATNKYDVEKFEERIAKLRGGVVIIQVGAATEPELKHKKALFDDSLNSTLAAKEEGVIRRWSGPAPRMRRHQQTKANRR